VELKKLKFKPIFFKAFERKDIVYVPGVYYAHELPLCPRKSFFLRVLNARIKPNELMLDGQIMHETLYKIGMQLVAEGYLREYWCEKEFKYNAGKITIIGHPDILGITPEKKTVVFEFKKTERDEMAINTLHAAYCAQANIYANMAEADMYCVVFVDRWTYDTGEYWFEPDKTAFKKMVEKAKYVDGCIEKQVIPWGPVFDWECKSRRHECQFKIICDKIGRQKELRG